LHFYVFSQNSFLAIRLLDDKNATKSTITTTLECSPWLLHAVSVAVGTANELGHQATHLQPVMVNRIRTTVITHHIRCLRTLTTIFGNGTFLEQENYEKRLRSHNIIVSNDLCTSTVGFYCGRLRSTESHSSSEVTTCPFKAVNHESLDAASLSP